MTPTPIHSELTFVLRTTWHIVEAGPLEGPVVGPYYVFKCLRWAARKDWLQVARGRPGDGERCVPCSVALERDPLHALDLPSATDLVARPVDV